jgi:two-component system, chemotaxis family, sensor histidine kinase and response regulator PixL
MVPAASPLHPARTDRRERHVLVVEDESPIRRVLADVLGDAGYAVLQAADGVEALQKLRSSRPDLIVLDLMMPGMSGWQFLEHSRTQLERWKIPVVILSAIEGKGDYPATLGVAAWLTKPIDVDKLIASVETMVGPARQVRRASTTDSSPPPPEVLIVEDESMIRGVIAEHLGEEGFQPREAETLADLRAAVADDPPDLILLDLMLPGESGFTFLRDRRDDLVLAAIPVVVLSAAPAERLLEAKDLGADAFLSKPFDIDALTALVRSFVR